MKVRMPHGAGVFWDGTIHSYGPDEILEIDDGNEQAVTWARQRAIEVLEDVQETPVEPSLADLRTQAEAKGLPTYGSKAQLAERIANAEEKEG